VYAVAQSLLSIAIMVPAGPTIVFATITVLPSLSNSIADGWVVADINSTLANWRIGIGPVPNWIASDM
jgi:hypothetical protein